MLCPCEGGMSTLFFSTISQTGAICPQAPMISLFPSCAHHSLSNLLGGVVLYRNLSNFFCTESCGKQQPWKEEAWWGQLLGLPQFLFSFKNPSSSFQSNVPPHLLTYPCSLWFPSVTEICVWAASHEGLSLTQKMLGGPSTLGTWLLLPQVCLPSHDAMLGCQVFHLGNTWHFQPQGLSTDAISKIIFEKATNILNS